MRKKFLYRRKNGVDYLCAPLLENKRLTHAFTTRHGGVSQGNLASLNLGLGRGDRLEHVTENYRRICTALAVQPERCIMANQIHSTNVQAVTMQDAGKGISRQEKQIEADGLVTNAAGLPLVIFCADCVPILLFHEKTHCLAAVHAGWRGTVGGIVKNAVRVMQETYGAVPNEILAAIGPSIGSCHFEVGIEVAEEFYRYGLQNQVKKSVAQPDKYMVDLWGSNREMLLAAGVLPEHIDIAAECTVCNVQRYFSHRGLGSDTGRMALIASLC